MFWWGLLAGIIIMSAFSLVALSAIDDQQESLAYFCAGPVAWVIVLVAGGYDLIRSAIHRRFYKALVVCPDGKIRYIDSSKVDNLLENEEGYCFPRFNEYAKKEGWCIDDWRKEDVTYKIASMRYAPSKVWKRYEKLC